MAARKPSQGKLEALQRSGTLNPRPRQVRDELFAQEGFFDPHDLLQVRYEMLRQVRREGRSVVQAAAQFGCSRPCYYKARADFDREGLAGLVPRKRGPRGGYRLTDEVLSFVQAARAKDQTLTAAETARLVEQRFGSRVHPSSIERALRRRGKKRP